MVNEKKKTNQFNQEKKNSCCNAIIVPHRAWMVFSFFLSFLRYLTPLTVVDVVGK